MSDAQKAYYIFHVKEMISFLQARFGKPDKIAISPTPNDFVGLEGIFVITGKQAKRSKIRGDCVI